MQVKCRICKKHVFDFNSVSFICTDCDRELTRDDYVLNKMCSCCNSEIQISYGFYVKQKYILCSSECLIKILKENE